ncbi:Reticulon [Artemisia annua]|uniref:Reticulon n=1 Tax=Artemisia annua TaxID=35608 RepID=A0A2U1NG85_ARTAN|nr:Reticulon [Artemisia annua]
MGMIRVGLVGGFRGSPPCLVLTDELLVSIATTVGGEINRALVFLQNVGSRGDIKQLAVICGSLLIAAIIEPGVTSGLEAEGDFSMLMGSKAVKRM